jgi:CheY-like chemotaxis protein
MIMIVNPLFKKNESASPASDYAVPAFMSAQNHVPGIVIETALSANIKPKSTERHKKIMGRASDKKMKGRKEKERIVKILAVDDVSSNIKLFELMTRSITNVSCTTCQSGKHALSLFDSKGKFDIIFLDIIMPEMSGYDTCISIRKIDKDVPVYATTGNSTEKDLLEILNSGFTHRIKKPFKKMDIIKAINNHYTDAVKSITPFRRRRRLKKVLY